MFGVILCLRRRAGEGPSTRSSGYRRRPSLTLVDHQPRTLSSTAKDILLDRIRGTMRLKAAVSMAAFVSLFGADIAHASWLDDAWSPESLLMNGTPAITFH